MTGGRLSMEEGDWGPAVRGGGWVTGGRLSVEDGGCQLSVEDGG